jgi:hypothetical protein
MFCARSAARWALLLMAAASPISGQTPQDGAAHVQAEMRHVDYRVDSTIVLQITYLRGELLPTTDRPPYFDDKTSFTIGIDSAIISISPAALGQLLNRYVFSYEGSPLRSLSLSVEEGQLKQEGRLHGISFAVLGDLTVTPEGDLRLHPTDIKTAGIKVGGLMRLFGLNLQKLVKLRGAPAGVQIEENDFILSPAALLPPPRVRGKVKQVQVRDSAVINVFRSDRAKIEPLHPPDPDVKNYMLYRGGTLRFGKLTMVDADLMIVDGDQRDPFDFFLDAYNQQLVAGYDQNLPDHGLIVHMPDFRHTASIKQKGGLRPNQP